VPLAGGAEGETEERTLLCFYTSSFPDPQFTELRPGMDLNLAWLDSVRMRLGELLVGRDGSVLGEAIGAASLSAPGSPTGAGGHASREAPLAAPGTSRRGEHLLERADHLFDDLKRSREAALAERDRLDSALREIYFARYPFMRQAIQHTTALRVADVIAEWVRKGCPEQVPPQAAATDAPAAAASPTTAPPPAEAPSAPSTNVPTPWPLAVELERTQALIAERARLLEELCELTGGHYLVPRRDPETGRPRSICGRCDALLDARAPEADDEWAR
jgi:hypothetical protein